MIHTAMPIAFAMLREFFSKLSIAFPSCAADADNFEIEPCTINMPKMMSNTPEIMRTSLACS